MTRFTVTGTAERFLYPERGIVHIRVGVSSLHKETAYNTAVKLHNKLAGEANGFHSAGVATWFGSSAPSSFSYQERWLPDGEDAEPQYRSRYTTSSSIDVKFRDFTTLGEWVARLTEEDLEFIDVDVEWALTEVTRLPLEKAVRGQAVANAREHASDYASGDGIDSSREHLRLVSVSDQHVSSYGGGVRSPAPAASSGSNSVAIITPEEIRVASTVTAVFKTV